MIAFRNVSYSSPDSGKPILNDVSFEIAKGEFAVISGDTGSGKTTILQLLTAELRPSSGEILVGSTELHSLKRNKIPDYRRRIGCVFQSIVLLQEKTASENIAFALEIHGKDSRDAIAKKVEEKLREVGLLEKANVYPRMLSHGEQRRISIARALVSEPLVLLADDITAQLDDASAEEVFAILRNEHIRGMTILITASNDRFFHLFPKSASHYQLTNGVVHRFMPESQRSVPA
jgi:cell division transport system ATP-binding protein